MRMVIGLAALLISAPAAGAEENRSMNVAQGLFTVKMVPQPADSSGVTRFALDKSFTGDLTGSSSGMMLSAGNPGKGEAGYVAVETVTATLAGRSGGFALQHYGIMSGGSQSLQIGIVPGSGSGDLAGISGRMEIAITGGTHHYTLHYALPAAP
jgi:hypothetical protein